MPLKEYHRPAGQPEALALLRRPEILTRPLIPGPRPEPLYDLEAEAVVDLSRLNLAYITDVGASIRLGAQTALQDVVESRLLNALANGIVPAAARFSAHLGLRHLATLAGALQARESAPDLALVLLAVGARVVVAQGAGNLVEMFLADYVAAARPDDELLIEVQVIRPPEAGAGGALERVARAPRDTAIMAAAAYVEAAQGRCRAARLALSQVGIPAARLASLAGALAGQTLAPASVRAVAEAVMAEASPSADFRGSADYRRAMAGVLTRRALETAWKNAEINDER